MDKSLNSPLKDSNRIIEWVWYEGTDALYEGEPVCYNTDYAGDGVTYAEARRGSHVERPTASNNTAFAGVAARNYSAKSTGQFIEINCPGSKCVRVALGVDTVINTGILTFTVAGRYDVGASTGLKTDCRFYTGKYRGRGSAIPRQTVTAVLLAGMTGGWSLANDGVTITATGAAAAGVAAGDTVVLLGGADDATDTVVPGKYTVSSVGTNTIVISSSAGAATTPTSACTCTGYAYTGNPTAICDLLDGEESGGVEFINLPNAGGDNQPYMVGGLSYVCGGVTLTNDAECELAPGVLPGDKKAFAVLGTLTGNTFVVDLATTNGIKLDGSSALAEINAMDAAADACYLEFHGVRWFTQDITGGTAEA